MRLSAEDEASRLRALAECRIVGSPPEEFFDDIAHQAAYLCGTSIGFISFIDAQREWLKAKVGWEGAEIPREQSFNALVLANPHVLIVEDTAADRRFHSHPWVTQSGIRFYAVAPVVSKEGYVLGAINVLDRLPRTLPIGHRRILQTLANAIAGQLDLRRASYNPIASANPDSRYQLLFDRNVAGFYRTTPDGRVLGCNSTFAQMLGYASREEVLGCQAQQFYFSVEERGQFLKALQREGSLVNSELRLRRKDGSSIWVVENVAATCDEQGNVTLIEGTMVDISAHKRAEDALRDSQERLLGIVTSAMDAIITVDEKQQIVLFNKAAEEIFRCSATEVVGKPIDRFVPESLRRIHREHIRAFGQTGVSTRSMYSPGTLVAVRSNGEEFPIEASISQVKTASERLYTVILRDISVRKRADEQLRQSQKMEAVGHLAGGIAHEFNNYLAIIMGYTDLLEREITRDSLRISLAEIKSASQKVASLTRQLLAFSRKQVIEFKEVDLNSEVWETHKLLRRLIPVTIDLIPKLEANLGKVKADPAQIQQILINLVLNARDSMPAGGQIVIETAEVELDPEYASRQLDVQPGQYVMLAVADTGIGMDQETLSHIFEPFFTTKEEGKGTGLGLSTTYGIVKQSGGHLTVASVRGKGSTFRIYLPKLLDSGTIVAEPSQAQPERPRRQTVLVVEDDSALRKLMMKVLEGAEFQVLEAKDGEQAVEICKSSVEPIDVVVSDLAMPKLTGLQLKEIVAGMRPTAKFLLISGYAEDVVEDPTILRADTNFLEKPFLPDELILKVRQILGDKSAAPPAVESKPPADVGT
jgi:PAS domain S-box-containing protein